MITNVVGTSVYGCAVGAEDGKGAHDDEIPEVVQKMSQEIILEKMNEKQFRAVYSVSLTYACIISLLAILAYLTPWLDAIGFVCTAMALASGCWDDCTTHYVIHSGLNVKESSQYGIKLNTLIKILVILSGFSVVSIVGQEIWFFILGTISGLWFFAGRHNLELMLILKTHRKEIETMGARE